jgi:hypothetical protein
LIVEVDDLWQARALVGDNRTNQRGRFVDEPLGRVLGRLRDAEALWGTGFAEPDLAEVRKRLDQAARAAHVQGPDQFGVIDPDAMEVDHRCPKCGYEWS